MSAAAAAAAAPALRPIARVVRARELLEGAGVLVRRTVGTSALPNLDPFLMLDHLSSTISAAKQGFPTHPHRGQTTVSIMLRGGMRHTDSMGNEGVVGDGGVQVMRAGNGVLHSEFPTAPRGGGRGAEGDEGSDGDKGDGDGAAAEIEGFQLWVNLPSALKRAPPGYQDVDASAIPTAALPPGGGGGGAATARVIAGALALPARVVAGPARISPPDVLLLDVTVPAGGSARLPVDDAFAGFCYVYEASAGAALGGAPAHARHAHVLSDPKPTDGLGTSEVAAEAGPDGPLRLLLVAGRPIGEPIVQHGPFVMNTRAEIEQAFREYSEGTFVKHGRDFDPFKGGGGGDGEL